MGGEDDESRVQPQAASWPCLPQLHITTSNETHEPQSIHPPPKADTRPPSRIPPARFSEITTHHAKLTIGESSDEDTEDEAEYEDLKEPINHQEDESPKEDMSPENRGSTETLVEAALDHDEARDRHVRFPDHLAESAALVQRILSTRRGNTDDEFVPSPTNTNSTKINIQPTGGSVLASLMKLESQRHQRRPAPKRTKSLKSKLPKKLRKKETQRASSVYEFSTDESSGAPIRPKLVNRPKSWLTTVASTSHLVPSLEKRKRASVQSMSRRTSIDSMFTTASQFEPITLEDRIRITFEIANILQKQEFLRKLAKSLMMYGCPAHRLEYIMRQVSTTLGVEAEYVYIPNVMFVTFFDQSTHTTETHFIRQSQVFDMHKLGEIYRLEKLLSHGEVSVDEALEFIDQVSNQPLFYPVWLNPFVYALASFCGAIMFYGGRWKEAGLSAALAMFFAVYELYSGRFMSFQPIWEITVCIFIGFVSRSVWKYDFCFTPVAFSSFIIILPGYSMAVAIIELVSRQLVSGVVRMVYAILYSFLLGYGVEMGSQLYGTIEPESISAQGQSPECQHALSAGTCITVENQWFYFLTVPLFALAYCVYLRARPSRWPTMVFVSVCGFVVNWALSCHAKAPQQVLQVVPSFAVGLIGNLLTKFTGKMSFDAVLLAIFYLVPGSLGLKAALGLFGTSASNEYSNQGAGFALSMIESAIGITVGLFVATLVVYPRGSTHTPLMNF
ncbi:hypothetical protein CLU79DRAFT_777507 [Phycomyces nitens]|nr:hypothetical protein CLU79DRAFT_777507 [Phycomyces nitens]